LKNESDRRKRRHTSSQCPELQILDSTVLDMSYSRINCYTHKPLLFTRASVSI